MDAWWRGLLPAGLILTLTALAAASGMLAPAERLAGDLRTRLLAQPIDSDALIIAIDADSLRTFNRWPWSRNVHADLLNRLGAAEPRAVFLDVDFSVPSGDPDADAALATALAQPRAHPVILPAFWQNADAASRTRRILTEPLPLLAGSAETGLVNVYPGADGLVRNAVHGDRLGARSYRSSAAILAGRDDLQPGTSYAIDFRIPPNSFQAVSYADVVSGAIPDEEIRGRTVLIGATAVELGDIVPVPLYRAVPGVILQAMLFETLKRGIPRTLPPALPMLIVLALVLTWRRFRRQGWRAQLVFALAAGAALHALSLYLHGAHDLMLEITAPLFAVVLCLFTGIVASADRQTLAAMLAAVSVKRERALISGVFSASIDGILVLSADGRIADANASAARLLGVKRGTLIGRSIRVFLPALRPSDPADTTLDTGRFELRASTPRGPLPVEVSLSPVAEDVPDMMTAILRDVSDRHRQQAVLRHQATHDPLTGLPNRTLLNELLQRLPAAAPAALFMLDLDGFKRVNDTLGHGVGDQVLRLLGKRLRQSLPRELKVFRLGGDEFAVLVSRYQSRGELRRLAELIIERVRAPVPAGTDQLELGGSIGIALYPEHAATGAALLQCADVAMYTAKSGRDHSAFYDATSDHNTLRNLKMVGALRSAVAGERLQILYQPKVRLRDGACCGVEALARWHDPELGEVSPAEFVPLAERSDLIDHLTRFVLRQALRDHARWCARGIDVGMAVNLSARHLTDEAFVHGIVTLVEERGMEPAQLELEITETALMSDPERARRVLGGLTRHGIRLAMDDFGTGFSSLAYLKHLNVHTLKIDRCFIQDLERSSSDRKIVESTLSMAHSLDLGVVAEGIENDGQAAILAALGCDIGQGYGLARPMTAEAFVAWHQAHAPARPALRSVSA
jgi:diguanylate cyclase (GGDEF)-like protein/PAS domain S-box-containing protein